MLSRSSIVLLLGLLLGASPVLAQAIDVDVESVPLAEALGELRAQTGVDVVFAEGLVAGHRATCRYRGASVEDALTCLLTRTALVARRVDGRQFVLVERPMPARPASSPGRGMLYGFVYDHATNEALPGAHVYLPELRRGTTTNDAGYFSIPSLPRTDQRVRITYLGYVAEDTVLVPGGRSARVALEPTTLEGGSILVEGRRSSQTNLAAIPGLVSLPVRQLQKLPSFLGGDDLFQSLQWLPGVRRSGELNGGLSIYGGNTDQNLYLLDGAPVYHPWHAFSLVSTFQTDTFKDIRLFRGSFPAEHGGRLVSVLDAEMRDGNRDRPQAVGALGVLSSRFLIESPLTRHSSFMVAGRRSLIDKIIGRQHPVENTDGQRDTLRTGYYYYDLSAKLTYRTSPRHRFALSYYNGGDDLDLRLPFDVSLDFDSWLRPADLFFEVDHNWQNELVSARYQFLQSRRFFVTALGYYSGYDAREAALVRPTTRTLIRSDYSVRLQDVGVKVDADYYHSISHQVRGGLQVVARRFESELAAMLQFSPGTADSLAQQSELNAIEVAGYVQDVWQPSPRWQLQPGVRVSYFSSGHYLRLSPRLNVRYAVLPERFVLRGAAGTQVQYLQRLRDRYSFLYDLVSSRWIPAGREVRPARSVQVALGTELYPRSWITLELEGYWRASGDELLPEDVYRIKDGLVGPGIEVGTLLQQYTPAEARAYGAEVSVRVERGLWQSWLSYAASRSTSRATELGEETYRPARYDVPRTLRAVVDRTSDHWSVTLSTELRTGYPNTVPVARYELGDPLDEDPVAYLHRPRVNNGRLPSYFRVDLGAAYRFGWVGGQWQVQAQLYNVLNRRNVVGRRYLPEQDRVVVEDRRGLPILPLLELELTL